MKEKKSLVKLFGLNKEDFVNFPVKMSSVQMARSEFYKGDHDFPNHYRYFYSKKIRNWKKQRKTQWK